MDDFEGTLNSILSSPETMSQIMALANSIADQPPAQTGAGPVLPEPISGQSPAAVSSVLPDSSLPDLSGLTSALSGEGNPLSILQNVNPAILKTAGMLFREYHRSDDEKAALLRALQPFLRPERWVKVEKAIQITRLSRVIRAAMQLFREKGYV